MNTLSIAIETLDVDEGHCPECSRFTTVLTVVLHDWEAPGVLAELCTRCLDQLTSF